MELTPEELEVLCNAISQKLKRDERRMYLKDLDKYQYEAIAWKVNRLRNLLAKLESMKLAV